MLHDVCVGVCFSKPVFASILYHGVNISQVSSIYKSVNKLL